MGNYSTVLLLALPYLTIPYDAPPTNPETKTLYGLRASIFITCPKDSENKIILHRILTFPSPMRFLSKPYTKSDAVTGTTTTAGVISAYGGGIVVPVAAMQQGVAQALLRMTECDHDALDGESLDILVHPLRFGIGEGVAAYGRGAIVSNLILLPLLWAALSYYPIPLMVSMVSKSSIEAARDTCGWPSCLLVPYTVFAEGSAMASMALVAMEGAGDIGLGAFGLFVLGSTVVLWLYLLCIKVPRCNMRLVFMAREGLFHRVADTRWEWSLFGERSNTEALAPLILQFNHCFGEYWWLWSSVAGYFFSLVVGLAEGMPNNTNTLCRARWAVACIGAVLQSLSVLTCTIPLQLVLLGATGILIVVLVGLVALATFNGGTSSSNAINVVGTINALIGIALMLFAIARLAYEFLWTRVSQRAHSPTTPALIQHLSDPLIVGLSDSVDNSVLVLQSDKIHEPAVELPAIEVYTMTDNTYRNPHPLAKENDRYSKVPQAWRSILLEVDDLTSFTTQSSGTQSNLYQ